MMARRIRLMALVVFCGAIWAVAMGNSAASPRSVVEVDNARFTVLTPALIRMEWSPTATFEDRASFTFVNRDLPVPAFTQRTQDGWLIIATDELTLRYRPDGGRFSPDNLEVLFSVAGEKSTWRPGLKPTGNLRGTTRTLDGVSGACPLEPGLLSRDGWSLVDDSRNLLFSDGPRRWATPRKERDALDWYFFGYGRDYPRLLGDYIKVAGRIPLPPRFAFGSWWSRYWAYSADELKQLVAEFDAHDVPLDVLVIDMDWHLEGWTGYTWNPDYFPNPEAFLAWTAEQGLRTTLNLHPHSGVQKHEAAFATFAQAMGLDPQTTDAIPFDSTDSRYMRAYFDILHHPIERQGVDFWWIDWQQGEASKIPGLDPLFWLNCLHWRDMLENPNRADERPLIFSRWGGLGNHRYPIGFSGDAFSNWPSLAFQPYFTATAGNVGFAYWSHDIGGHQPGPVEPELYTRWVQFGALSPILRTHTTKREDAERRIWEFPKPYFQAMRDAFHLRYELIPYIYTMARKCYDTGLPLCRPLYYAWPERDEAYEHPNQYMFGDDLLVAPILSPADEMTGYAHRQVWLPPGRWINWLTDDMHDGPGTVYVQADLDEIPIFGRAGAIVPTSRWAERTARLRDDLAVLHVFPGESGEAVLYEDDGISREFATKGGVRTRITAAYEGEQYTVTVHPAKGALPDDAAPRAYELRYHVLSPIFPQGAVRVNGQEIEECDPSVHHGWFYDTDTMQFVVRTAPVDRKQPMTVALQVRYAYSENTWLARGLRGRMRAIEDAERLIAHAHQPDELDARRARAEWNILGSYDKAAMTSLLAQAMAMERVKDSDASAEAKRSATARLLGLIPQVDIRPVDASATELSVTLAAVLSRTPLFQQDQWNATIKLSPPRNWQVAETSGAQERTAKIDERIERQVRLHRAGDLQTTVLDGEITVEVPDVATVGIPFSKTLFPSINRWHLIGPFDAPGDDRLQKVFPPEQKIDLTATYAGQGDKPIGWQLIERPIHPDSDLTDEFFVEFHKYFDGIKYNTVAYALAYLHAPEDLDASLAFGSDDGIVIWLNDEEIHRQDVGRAYTPKEDRVPVKLKAGPNKLLVKISQGGGMWGFGMHVETPDGRPVPEVLVKWSADTGTAGTNP